MTEHDGTVLARTRFVVVSSPGGAGNLAKGRIPCLLTGLLRLTRNDGTVAMTGDMKVGTDERNSQVVIVNAPLVE